jgi:hypothetical protein
MSGTLNVDDPSPTPNVVLTAENKAEYVVLLTACPLHNKNRIVELSDFVGSEANPAMMIPPAGMTFVTS